MKLFKSIFVPLFAAAVVMTLIVPSELRAQAGTGQFEGTIFKDDLKTPAPNAVAKIKKTETGEEYQSKPADANGAFSISGIKEGWYGLGVTAAEGNFNFEYKELFIKQGETAKLRIVLRSGLSKGFFASPVGIAAMIISPGEEALRACRSAMEACEQASSASEDVEARLAYQRAMLTCEQAYFNLIAAYRPEMVNGEDYKKGLALCQEARSTLDKLNDELAAETPQMHTKGLGDESSVSKAKDAIVKKYTETVKKVRENIQKKLEPQRVTAVCGVRG